MPERLLNAKQVHAEYGLAPSTLANYRWLGIGPAYVRTTPSKYGRVRYRRSDIEAWLNSQTVSMRGAA